MKGCIADIESTWKRRTVLCLIFPLAVGLLIVMELLDTVIEMTDKAVVTFKQTWKGV